jgi:hypothetical protein
MIDNSAPDVVCGVDGGPLSCSSTVNVPAETVSVDSISRIFLVDTSVEFESQSCHEKGEAVVNRLDC